MTSINSLPHAKEVFVKNDDEYVKQGINLPPIIHSTIYCKSVANVVGILGNDKSMNTIISMLIADDYDGISEHFQCAVKTPLEVMEVYKKDLGTQIDNKQKEYTYVSSKTYSTQKAKDDAVEKVSKELNSMKTRLASLIENITSINDDNSCAICYEAISKPILFPCCGHVFCSQCIFDSLKMGLKKCAYCNSPLEMDKVVLLTEKDHNTKNKNKEDQVRTRLDACINKITSILETNPDAKILLFSEFDGTFSKVNNKLKELKIVYEHLQGSSNHIAAMLKRLSSGDTKVLLLNSRLFGAGLNISQASDLIIYHKMSDTLRVQIIGRSHRMGRVGSLNVHQILSEDEK
jgi:SNF2 family DNA or RNA helicase